MLEDPVACYTPPVTKYDLFRKRIAPLAFALAVGLMAYQTCQKHERTHATVVLDFGSVEHDVRQVEAEIWMNGEQVTQFRRTASEGAYIGPARFKTSLPDQDGELRVDVDLANGQNRHIVRRLHIEEGATATIALEPDLR